MTHPNGFSVLLSRALTAAGVVALATITLASPGATRMYAWPWSCLHGAACVVPLILLALRLFDSRRPFVLPAPAWTVATLFAALAIVVSALASPYRGSALLWSAPLLAGLALVFVIFDWLHADPALSTQRHHQLLNALGLLFVAIALTSLALWAQGLTSRWREEILVSRNPFPLGHSNYTAGLALLMLPLFSALAFATRGLRRASWLLAALLAVVLIFTSGSRGGLLGLTALALVNVPGVARVLRLRLWMIALAAVIALGALFYFNPRARALLTGERASAVVRESNDQRSAMLAGGFALGHARPLLGWGPGTTPLAYPRVRHLLNGGVENVLQLHDVPIQLYAEFGALGLIAALGFLALAIHAAWKSPAARTVFFGVFGYIVFSVTDWQIEVPIFTVSLAVALALLIPPPSGVAPVLRQSLIVTLLVALGAFALFARPDPAPALNVRALDLARDPAQSDAAIALLRHSLSLNPDQEIAHFNLGWLLVTRDPTTAEKHFRAAAQLVPDKGGVYFGLALARLNQEQRSPTIRALALEALNDPLFLTSPWWRQPALAAFRAETVALTASFLASPAIARSQESETRYLSALIAWLENRARPGEILAAANTSERVGYFARRPLHPDFSAASVRVYRRERTGYPVLMRNLDLPVPTDLFDVQENSLAASELSFLFPRKGWLPAPLLLPLLDDSAPSHRGSNIENRN